MSFGNMCTCIKQLVDWRLVEFVVQALVIWHPSAKWPPFNHWQICTNAMWVSFSFSCRTFCCFFLKMQSEYFNILLLTVLLEDSGFNCEIFLGIGLDCRSDIFLARTMFMSITMIAARLLSGNVLHVGDPSPTAFFLKLQLTGSTKKTIFWHFIAQLGLSYLGRGEKIHEHLKIDYSNRIIFQRIVMSCSAFKVSISLSYYVVQLVSFELKNFDTCIMFTNIDWHCTPPESWYRTHHRPPPSCSG